MTCLGCYPTPPTNPECRWSSDGKVIDEWMDASSENMFTVHSEVSKFNTRFSHCFDHSWQKPASTFLSSWLFRIDPTCVKLLSVNKHFVDFSVLPLECMFNLFCGQVWHPSEAECRHRRCFHWLEWKGSIFHVLWGLAGNLIFLASHFCIKHLFIKTFRALMEVGRYVCLSEVGGKTLKEKNVT